MLPTNDSFIEGIAERLRAVIARQPRHGHDEMASILQVSPEALHRLLEDRERSIDICILIDVVAALVREFAVDPQWLLIGQYDAATHREAIELGEVHNDEGSHAIRNFVAKQFHELRERLRRPQTPPFSTRYF